MARNDWEVREEKSLLDFLLQYSGKSKKTIKESLGAGLVFVNEKTVRKGQTLLKIGDRVSLQNQTKEATFLPFEILYEDEDLLAIDKPSGLLSVSGGLEKERTAYHICREYLRKKNPQALIFVVHRLDKDTSGVLLFAKNEKIKHQLQENWNGIVRERGYIAFVEGRVEKQTGTLKNYLSESKTQQVYISNAKSGKLAITHYRVLKYVKDNTLLEIYLDTGRKNQIRVQLAAISHPLIGDVKYNPHHYEKTRLCLHAHRLSLVDPRSGKLLTIEAPHWDSFGKRIRY